MAHGMASSAQIPMAAGMAGKKWGKERLSGAPRKPTIFYGLALAALVAVVAVVLGRWLPLIGGPVFGILIGIAIRNMIGVGPLFTPGLAFASKKVLQWSIIALGFGLSLNQVASVGLESLSVTLVTISAAFVSAYFLGKWLGIPSKLKILIGVGTAICGGSAIAATAPIIKPEDHETAFAISTIFIFNVAAVLIFPVLGHWMNLSDMAFGMWAGTAINDTSSVVAAGYSYSNAAGDYATIVKLTRATLIIPICLGLVFLQAWQQKRNKVEGFNFFRIFPWFILWFVAASALRTSGLMPEVLLAPIKLLADFMIVLALTAIGLSSNFRQMAVAGWSPILLGMGVWAAVAVSGLLTQAALGIW